MLRRFILFGGLAATAAVSFGFGKLWPERKEEPTVEVMPERWARLQGLEFKSIGQGLVKVGEGKPSRPAQWFLEPKEHSLIGADTRVDSTDAEAVAKLKQRIRFLAVSGQVPMDGLWQYENGQWHHVELDRALQEAIDDTAYNFESQRLENTVERDHSGEHSVVELTRTGQLTPPAERVRFGNMTLRWELVIPLGILTREPNTVLEWYRLTRVPTVDELRAIAPF